MDVSLSSRRKLDFRRLVIALVCSLVSSKHICKIEIEINTKTIS